MFLQVYGVTLALLTASVALGQAICTAAGWVRERAWAAPMVGLSALIIVTSAAIKLPGRAVTAAAIGLLLTAGALVYLVVRRRWPINPSGLGVVVLSLLVVSIPFLANGRVGLQGVSLDNDTSAHLLWAEAVRSPYMYGLYGIPSGYPLGPHNLVASLGTLLDVPLDAALTALLVSVAPLTALAGMGVLVRQAAWRRMLVAVLCAIPFLVVGYYGEGAFKETLMAGLVLAFAVHLDQVKRRWSDGGDSARWLWLAPVVLLVSGAIYVYSYVAVGWFAATVGVWGVAELVVRPARAYGWVTRRNLLMVARPLALILAVLIILILPIAGQVKTFFSAHGAAPTTLPSPLGNLAGPVSAYEMFGVSLNPDFRTVFNTLGAGEVAAFSLGVFAFGLLWSLRRRDLLLPAAAAGAILLWWIADRGTSPYVAAKGLVIASPLVMAVALRPLLTRVSEPWLARILRGVVALVFCGLVGYTSYRSLQDTPVQASVPGQNLEAFHRFIGRSKVLFLGFDEYATWLLRDAPVGNPTGQSAAGVGAPVRPNKPLEFGQANDFDSADPSSLDQFRYIVTTTSDYNSQAYENFRLIASGRFYELWERAGPTVPRQVLEPQGAPGAILNCRSKPGRRLHLERGVASVMPTPPILVPGPYVRPGGVATVMLPLPVGRWELSIQYSSALDVGFSASGRDFSIPAYLGRVGPFFAIGSVEGAGMGSPVALRIRSQRPTFMKSFDNLSTQILKIAATPLPNSRRLIPLSKACGRYVDWYRLT